MKVVLQRVNSASVTVNGQTIAAIRRGVLCYVSYAATDTEQTFTWMAAKIANLRIFPELDGKDRFDQSLREINGEVLIVSNFTLHADCRKGRRPDFIDAAPPQVASGFHTKFLEILRKCEVSVYDGQFGAHMRVLSENDGPVTFILEKE